MHICVVCDFFGSNYGGAEKVTRNWVKKLLERGHKVTVLTAHRKKVPFEKNKNFKIIKFLGFPIPKTKKRAYGAVPLNPFKLYKLWKLFRDEIDIVHIFMVPSLISSTAITFARWAKKPVVSSIHVQPEYIGYNTSYNSTSPVDKILIFLEKFIPMHKKSLLKWSYGYLNGAFFNKSNLVVGPSKFALDAYKKHGLHAPSRIISNGLDFGQYNGNGRAEIFVEKYHLANSGPRVLFVGRLHAEKKVDVLLKAAKIVCEQIPDAKFIIIGDGSEDERLKLMAKKLGIEDNVLFTGRISDKMLPHAYHASDLFAFPSILELQGLVLLEAMSAGNPVIGTKICAIPESVRDGWNGYTFKKNNYKELAEKMLKVLKNKELHDKFASNSMKFVKQHDIEKSIDQIEDEYKRLHEEFRLAS